MHRIIQGTHEKRIGQRTVHPRPAARIIITLGVMNVVEGALRIVAIAPGINEEEFRKATEATILNRCRDYEENHRYVCPGPCPAGVRVQIFGPAPGKNIIDTRKYLALRTSCKG